MILWSLKRYFYKQKIYAFDSLFQKVKQLYFLVKKGVTHLAMFTIVVTPQQDIRFICQESRIWFEYLLKKRISKMILASANLGNVEQFSNRLGAESFDSVSVSDQLLSWEESLFVLSVPSLLDFNAFQNVKFNFKQKTNENLRVQLLQFL